VAGRFCLAERGYLEEQRHDERHRAERPAIGAAHDVQRRRGGLAASQAVRQIGQAVEVQAPGEQCERADREAGRGQRPGAERVIGHEQHGGGDDAEQQADGRRPRHRGGRVGPRRRGWGLTPARAPREHGEQGHR
jgi:hypothetical protein